MMGIMQEKLYLTDHKVSGLYALDLQGDAHQFHCIDERSIELYSFVCEGDNAFYAIL